jgi:hypothetical protein
VSIFELSAFGEVESFEDHAHVVPVLEVADVG